MDAKTLHEKWAKARPRDMKALARWLGSEGDPPPTTAVVYAHRALLRCDHEGGRQVRWCRLDGATVCYTPTLVAAGFQRALSFHESMALQSITDHLSQDADPDDSWDGASPELLSIAEELLELASEDGDPLSHRATRLHVLRDQLMRRGR